MAGNASAIRAGRAYVELFGDDDKLRTTLDSAAARVKGFGLSIAAIGAKLGGLGVALATPLGIATKMFAGSELNDMSARTGMSVERLSELGHAAQQTGTDLGTVEGAVRKMQKALSAAANGNTQATVAFESLGLSVERLSRLSPDQQFEAVARAISAVPNPTAKAAAAMTLLGKSGTALLPMIGDLDALTREARDLGLVMSTEDARAADALGDAMDSMVAVAKRTALTIGAALAPALTDLAGWLTRVVIDVNGWLRENQGLVVTIGKVALGLVAVGGALVVVGGLVSAFGVAIGAVSAALGIVGSVLAALLSPIGLIVAAFAAGGAALVYFTEVGSQALGWLGQQFEALKSDAITAFGGMADAMAAGDLMLAGKILWAALKIEWLKGTNYLKGVWSDWGLAFVQVWADAKTAVAGLMIDLVDGARAIWADLTASMSGSWGDLIKTLLPTLNPVAQALQALGFDVGGLVDQGLNAVGLQTGQADQARQTALAQIGTENMAAHRALTDQATADTEARREGAANSMAGAAADLAAAQEELAKLTGEAGKKRESMIAGAAASKPGSPTFTPEGLDQALAASPTKVDTRGTFSGALVGLLGAGDSTASDQLKEQKKTNKGIDDLNKNIERARWVLTD